MPSSEYRFQGEDVGYADMAEAPRRERESKVKAVGIGIVVSLTLLFLTGLMIFGSQPALTPEEIVGRNDYEGEQPARHIFNLYSLKQDQQKQEAERAKQAAMANTREKSISAKPLKTAEMPASAVVSNVKVMPRPQPVVEQNYVKAELSRTPASVISAVTPKASSSDLKRGPAPGAENPVTVLPVYTIKGNQTNMRSLPTTDAPILQILNKGQAVTVFDENGEWVQIAVNDGSGISGYVHQSLLESQVQSGER